MIRTLVTLAGTLDAVPSERYLTMRLLYRDDYTPDDYEPEYFTAARDQTPTSAYFAEVGVYYVTIES
jgi:hypothetical protein